MSLNIIQWNLNGFDQRLINLQKLIIERDAKIICLQETNFKNDFCAKSNRYNHFHKNRQARKGSGGVAIYIKKLYLL